MNIYFTTSKEGKDLCHKIFDDKWEDTKTRRNMYIWLAKQLGIKNKRCHFSKFDVEMLNKAYDILLSIKDRNLSYDCHGRIIWT